MKRILINADRAHLPIDGMNRVLLETIKSLDVIAEKDRYVMVMPANVNDEYYDRIKALKNIRIRRTPLPYFRFWTLLFVDLAGLLSRRTVVNFGNRNGIFGGGINVLNDIIPIRFYGSRDRKYLRTVRRLLNTSDCLILPSEFTRDDVMSAMDCRCRMRVVHLGWQHYPDIPEDDTIFSELPDIAKGSYYFTISTISPHKNLRFIYEAAKRNPDQQFVVAGAMNRGYGFDCTDLKNLRFTGWISDPKAKALMVNCRAFIFPSLYEGAGLPPLEALSCNVPVLAADIGAVREYCGDAVHYFDPHDFDIDIEGILNTEVSKPEEALGRLSWDRTARELKDIIES